MVFRPELGVVSEAMQHRRTLQARVLHFKFESTHVLSSQPDSHVVGIQELLKHRSVVIRGSVSEVDNNAVDKVVLGIVSNRAALDDALVRRRIPTPNF